MKFDTDPNWTKRALVIAATVLVASACRDNSNADVAATDSALARDITLASAVAAPTPQLRDMPDSTPPVEASLPEPKAEPKTRRPTAPKPTPVREQPKPVTPPPTPR
jgi:hypothetical protein